MTRDNVFKVQPGRSAARIGIERIIVGSIFDVEQRINATQLLGRLGVIAKRNGQLTALDVRS